MLKKLLFKKEKYLYVDWDYLKDSYENGRLKGADVFARLFDMIDDDLFVRENKDEYDLTHYDIYVDDWVLFYSFVRNGYIPTTYDPDINMRDLNYCYDICIKFGGVPEFEKYYYSFVYEPLPISEKNEDDTTVYNPMNPGEDYKGLYNWRMCASFTSLHPNESVTTVISTEPITIMLCRNPKETQNS